MPWVPQFDGDFPTLGWAVADQMAEYLGRPDAGDDEQDEPFIVTREQHVRGWVDLDTGTVTLQADGAANPLVTGLTGGELYGGQTIGKVTVGTTPQTFAVDPTAAG